MRAFLIAFAVLYFAGASLAQSIVLDANDCAPPSDMASQGAEEAVLWTQTASGADLPIKVTAARKPRKSKAVSWVRVESNTGETIWRREQTCGD